MLAINTLCISYLLTQFLTKLFKSYFLICFVRNIFFVFASASRLTKVSYVLCSSVNMCRVSFITTLLTKFYMTVCMLLTCGKHFARPHHFSRREVLTYNRTIEMHIPSQESVWLCICVRDINFTSVSTIFQ